MQNCNFYLLIYSNEKDSTVANLYKKLETLREKMLNAKFEYRPDCDQILKNIGWILRLEDMKDNKKFIQIIQKGKTDDYFHEGFIQQKYNFRKRKDSSCPFF